MTQIVFPDCQELIEESQRASSVEELHAICSKACQMFGFDQFLYGSRVPTSFVREGVQNSVSAGPHSAM